MNKLYGKININLINIINVINTCIWYWMINKNLHRLPVDEINLIFLC